MNPLEIRKQVDAALREMRAGTFDPNGRRTAQALDDLSHDDQGRIEARVGIPITSLHAICGSSRQSAGPGIQRRNGQPPPARRASKLTGADDLEGAIARNPDVRVAVEHILFRFGLDKSGSDLERFTRAQDHIASERDRFFLPTKMLNGRPPMRLDELRNNIDPWHSRMKRVVDAALDEQQRRDTARAALGRQLDTARRVGTSR